MTTRTFEKQNDIFKCKLLLEDGSEFTIPLREDGYIYATGLCKVAKKKMYHWIRLKETQNLKNNLDEKLKADNHIRMSGNDTKDDDVIRTSLEIYKGGNDKYSQGTWIHPDLAINLAQWCSVTFALQVGKWMKELIFTGKVEIGEEKSENDIINELRLKLKEAENKVQEAEKKVEASENLVKAYDSNHKDMEQKYRKIYLNHQAYLRRKDLYKLKMGPCVYIIDMKNSYHPEEEPRYKIGQTKDINSRVSDFRTSNPFLKVMYVFYTEKHIDLEKSMKNRYEKNLLPNNSEFITGVSYEKLIDTLLKMADIHEYSYTIESVEELDKFNRHIILESEVEEVNDDAIQPSGMKRCGGFRHKTEEERLQPLENFFKHKLHKDGRARLCKECFLIGVYGDKRKKRKIVTLPEFNTEIHKWCNLCESVKEYKDFYHDKANKDGYNSNCKECKNNMKKTAKSLSEDEKKQKKEIEMERKREEDKIRQASIEEIKNKNPLQRYEKRELMEMMKAKGLKVTYRMTKDQMIEHLKMMNLVSQ